MAVAAEAYYHQDVQELQWDIQRTGAEFVMSQVGVWLAADAIPELQSVRQEADSESARIYEGHMVQLREGQYDLVPLDSDSVSSADRVLETEVLYGVGSPQHDQALTGLFTNFHRYIGETWSKLGPEYFGKLEHVYEPELGDYLSFGTPITPMIHRGITPLAEVEEVPRRFMENRENSTNNRLGELVMRAAGLSLVDGSVPAVALPSELRKRPVSSQTISECPDHIVARYQSDNAKGLKRSYSGYAPQIKKLMLRDTAFDPATGKRYVEQLSVAGEYITHEVVLRYLELRGVIAEGETPDKTEVLGLQMITGNTDGVLGMAKALDAIASELSGQTIFLGEVVDSDAARDYDSFPAEAAARQEKQRHDAQELALYSLELARENVEHALASKLIDELVKKQMFAVAKQDPTFAEVAFDKETADELRQAQTARERGDYARAEQIEDRAERRAPPPEGCSGGACEIKDVNPASAEGQELAKITRAKLGDKISKDESTNPSRRCKCGGQLAYAHTLNRVNTACLKCGSFKSKIMSAKKPD